MPISYLNLFVLLFLHHATIPLTLIGGFVELVMLSLLLGSSGFEAVMHIPPILILLMNSVKKKRRSE